MTISGCAGSQFGFTERLKYLSVCKVKHQEGGEEEWKKNEVRDRHFQTSILG